MHPQEIDLIEMSVGDYLKLVFEASGISKRHCEAVIIQFERQERQKGRKD